MMQRATLRGTSRTRLGAAPPCVGMLQPAASMCRRNATTIPTPTARLKSLRQLMASQPLVRMLEVHNGLTALVSTQRDNQTVLLSAPSPDCHACRTCCR